MVKKRPAMQKIWVRSLSLEDLLEKGRLPTLVFLPGESHGQGSLVDFSPWGRTESDTTERLSTQAHTHALEYLELHTLFVISLCSVSMNLPMYFPLYASLYVFMLVAAYVCLYVASILEKAMAPHSSTLAWKIPWAGKPGRRQSMGSRRVGHD